MAEKRESLKVAGFILILCVALSLTFLAIAATAFPFDGPVKPEISQAKLAIASIAAWAVLVVYLVLITLPGRRSGTPIA